MSYIPLCRGIVIYRYIDQLAQFYVYSNYTDIPLFTFKTDHWNEPRIIRITQENFNWLDTAKVAIKDAEKNNQKYILLSEHEPSCGIIGMFNCLKREPGGSHFRSVPLKFPLKAYVFQIF